MRAEPKARRRLDHLDPATDEDYFVVEASLVKQVLQNIPALASLGTNAVRALSSLTQGARKIASQQPTRPASRRWKFVLKAIELIEKHNADLSPKEQVEFFGKLAELDPGFALERAGRISDPATKYRVLRGMIEELLEEAIELAQPGLYKDRKNLTESDKKDLSGDRKDLSGAKWIFQKAIKIAYQTNAPHEMLSKIVSAYLKTGLMKEARELADSIDNIPVRIKSLADIAAATKNPQAREKIFDEAIALISDDSPLEMQFSAFSYIVGKLTIGDPEKAEKLLTSTLNALEKLSPTNKPSALKQMIRMFAHFAAEIAGAELLEKVIPTIKAHSSDHDRIGASRLFAYFLAEAKLPQQAIDVISAIGNHAEEASVLLSIGEKLSKLGHETDALQLFHAAFEKAKNAEELPEVLPLSRETFAEAFAALGLLDEAEQLVTQIAPPEKRASVLLETGERFALLDRQEDAKRVFNLVVDVAGEIGTDTTLSFIKHLIIMLQMTEALAKAKYLDESKELFQMAVQMTFSALAIGKYHSNEHPDLLMGYLAKTASEFARQGRLEEILEIITDEEESFSWWRNMTYLQISKELTAQGLLPHKADEIFLEAVNTIEKTYYSSAPASWTTEIAVKHAKMGRHQEAYDIVQEIFDEANERAPALSELARERAKEDPEAGWKLFEEAFELTASPSKPHTEVTTHKVIAGFPTNEDTLLYTDEFCGVQMTDKASELAKIDLEAAEEVFQDAIVVGLSWAANSAVLKKAALQLVEVGLSKEPLIEKTSETYALVSAHYAMEIYRAEQIDDSQKESKRLAQRAIIQAAYASEIGTDLSAHYAMEIYRTEQKEDSQKKSNRLSQLALRQAAYDPEIGRATCEKISDPQKKGETLTRITVMQRAGVIA